MLDSVSYTENNLPIEYYHALHPGDRSRFEVDLVRMREPIQKSIPTFGSGSQNEVLDHQHA